MEEYNYKKFAEHFEGTPGNKDSHYSGGIQPSHFAAGNRMIFTLANILKYPFRYKDKQGQQDLEKTLWYTRFQIMDHDNFLPPVFMRKRITIEAYLEANPQFNDMQAEVSSLAYHYNISSNLYHLHVVEDIMVDYIKDYDKNER